MENLIIAIDGPAGAGKSTISKLVSKRLDINYLDTGAMYRAITYKCIEEGININNEEEVIKICESSDVDFRNNQIYLDGKNIDIEIRRQEVSSNVSNVAKIKKVRKLLVARQREIASESDAILDGRDVGTCIFPDARYKFFLSASAQERGRRRYEELKSKGEDVDLDNIIEDIKKRDKIDSTREVSPLIKAEDAIEIDSTSMSINEVVDYIIDAVESDKIR
ncbi:cytidylate kinase [Peptostreptococcus russellii]|uniref:Cytidylate kinase n=1 Tax=Peptostreptococcus russellii TaxID=215200 RepID=A0A2P7Q1P9_9FIRM|nr:(d)CMP kinase [Peptostreptococcus russellii]PSJ31870.1 cytidylate kinase [Peptostreptococcus russellii]